MNESQNQKFLEVLVMAKLIVTISILIFFFFNLLQASDTNGSLTGTGTSKESVAPTEKPDEPISAKDFSLCDTETNKAKCCKEKYANNVKRCARTLRMKMQRGK